MARFPLIQRRVFHASTRGFPKRRSDTIWRRFFFRSKRHNQNRPTVLDETRLQFTCISHTHVYIYIYMRIFFGKLSINKKFIRMHGAADWRVNLSVFRNNGFRFDEVVKCTKISGALIKIARRSSSRRSFPAVLRSCGVAFGAASASSARVNKCL